MKTLAMIKMEKNFIAHMKKKYPRKPYIEYNYDFLIRRLEDEVTELKGAINRVSIHEAKSECADVSNIIDFIFEKLCMETAC